MLRDRQQHSLTHPASSPPAPATATACIPLDASVQQRADQFCQIHSDLTKAEQVYCNTLAVWAVHQYLQAHDISTDLEVGDAWNPVMQVCMDVADLVLWEGVTLECRPIFRDVTTLDIPMEVMADRAGYVVVQLDDALEQATLLGFIKQAKTTQVAIANLTPIVDLPPYLHLLKASAPARPSLDDQPSVVTPLRMVSTPKRPNSPTLLTAWLNQSIHHTWSTLDTLLSAQAPVLAYRTDGDLKTDMNGDVGTDPEPMVRVTRGKVLPFAPNGIDDPITLLVEIMPKEGDELNIWVKLCPQGDREYLPTDLKLGILDETGTEILAALSRGTKVIELNFSGESGDRFDVKVGLGDYSVVESFVV